MLKRIISLLYISSLICQYILRSYVSKQSACLLSVLKGPSSQNVSDVTFNNDSDSDDEEDEFQDFEDFDDVDDIESDVGQFHDAQNP